MEKTSLKAQKNNQSKDTLTSVENVSKLWKHFNFQFMFEIKFLIIM